MEAQHLQQLLQGLVQGLAQQEVDRRANQNIRDLIQDLVRQTTVCDWSSTSSVRNWIREATLAFNQVGVGHIIELVSKTVTGPLRFELEWYIDNYMQTNNVARAAVPWNDIRIHLSTQFLNVDEASALRDEVEQLRQSAYEPEVSYSHRYKRSR